MSGERDLIEGFADTLWMERGLSANTLAAYQSDLRALGLWLGRERGRGLADASRMDLLDYLADEFVRDGWSTKRLIRRIVLTATYQQRSTLDATPEQLRERQRLYGVARRKRLEVESLWRTLSLLEYDPQSKDRRLEPLANAPKLDKLNLSYQDQCWTGEQLASYVGYVDFVVTVTSEVLIGPWAEIVQL